MKVSTRISALALAAGLGASIMAPGVAMASQKSKNQWRNIGIGAAAVGAYGLLKGDKTLTAVGAAGAGYSAYRYEQDRHHQSQESAARNRSYHRNYSTSARKYYYYDGHRYYMNLRTGERVRMY